MCRGARIRETTRIFCEEAMKNGRTRWIYCWRLFYVAVVLNFCALDLDAAERRAAFLNGTDYYSAATMTFYVAGASYSLTTGCLNPNSQTFSISTIASDSHEPVLVKYLISGGTTSEQCGTGAGWTLTGQFVVSGRSALQPLSDEAIYYARLWVVVSGGTVTAFFQDVQNPSLTDTQMLQAAVSNLIVMAGKNPSTMTVGEVEAWGATQLQAGASFSATMTGYVEGTVTLPTNSVIQNALPQFGSVTGIFNAFTSSAGTTGNWDREISGRSSWADTGDLLKVRVWDKETSTTFSALSYAMAARGITMATDGALVDLNPFRSWNGLSTSLLWAWVRNFVAALLWARFGLWLYRRVEEQFYKGGLEQFRTAALPLPTGDYTGWARFFSTPAVAVAMAIGCQIVVFAICGWSLQQMIDGWGNLGAVSNPFNPPVAAGETTKIVNVALSFLWSFIPLGQILSLIGAIILQMIVPTLTYWGASQLYKLLPKG